MIPEISRETSWPEAIDFPLTLSSLRFMTTPRVLSGMAQSNPRYLTEDAYRQEQRAQDDFLSKEFEKQYNHTETRHRELRDDHRALRDDHRELRDDHRKLRNDLDELKVEFQQMKGRMYNQSVRTLFLRITPIGVYQPETGLVMPARFPKNAHDFWKLRAPRTSSQSTYC